MLERSYDMEESDGRAKQKREQFKLSRKDPASTFNTSVNELQNLQDFQERNKYRLLVHRRRSLNVSGSLDEPDAPPSPVVRTRQFSHIFKQFTRKTNNTQTKVVCA